MIRKINIKNEKIANEVLELQRNSYKAEAEIINCYDIPPLKDTLESLMKCGEVFYGYLIKNKIKSVISYKVANNTLDIHRVAIHPDHFRKGIARRLLEFIGTVEEDFSRIEVCTGKKNILAKNLYLQSGFSEVSDI